MLLPEKAWVNILAPLDAGLRRAGKGKYGICNKQVWRQHSPPGESARFPVCFIFILCFCTVLLGDKTKSFHLNFLAKQGWEGCRAAEKGIGEQLGPRIKGS